MKTYLYKASNLKSSNTFQASFISEINFWRPPPPPPQETVVSCDLFVIVRVCGSTLYLGLAHGSQYKLPDNFSTNPTTRDSLWRHTCIENQI